jgi:uncharacterized membrane protein
MESVEKRTTAVARLALLAGVMLSFVFLIAGLVIGLGGNGSAGGLDGDLLLNIGILVLLGTPVVRVMVLAAGYLRERQITFALVAFCILLLLGTSVAIGLHGE